MEKDTRQRDQQDRREREPVPAGITVLVQAPLQHQRKTGRQHEHGRHRVREDPAHGGHRNGVDLSDVIV